MNLFAQLAHYLKTPLKHQLGGAFEFHCLPFIRNEIAVSIHSWPLHRKRSSDYFAT